MGKKIITIFVVVAVLLSLLFVALHYFFLSDRKYDPEQVRFIPKLRREFWQETPPMGWNGWNKFRCDPALNEKSFMRIADLVVETGMKDAGYTYVNLDDCWQIARDEQGNIIVDAKRFPNGIKYLADYVHQKGLKFGIYTSGGSVTCEKRPGSLTFEARDAQTYANWGVDYIKIDWCGIEGADTYTQYKAWRSAIDETGRKMIISIAIANIDHVENRHAWIWGRELAGIWRTAIDIQAYWPDVLRVMDKNSLYAEYSGRGGWNDADMLQVGNGMTYEEDKSHFIMWSMMASPLLAGNDLREMSEETRKILTHKGVIALNQDPLGVQASMVRQENNTQVWMKLLQYKGRRAVALLNRSEQPQQITFRASELGLYDLMYITDVWQNKDVGFRFKEYAVVVQPHDTAIFTVQGIDAVDVVQFPVLPRQVRTGALLDQEHVWQERAELDESESQGDDKALQAHLYSDIRYHLGGVCKNLRVTLQAKREYMGPNSAVRFRIYGDGSLIYKSEYFTEQSAAKTVEVDVSKVRVLNLVVNPRDPSLQEAQIGLWINPYIICE